MVANYASYLGNESTRFLISLAYTKTSFGAFVYVPRKRRTLCGQCEKKDSRTLDACSQHAKSNCLIESTEFNSNG